MRYILRTSWCTRKWTWETFFLALLRHRLIDKMFVKNKKRHEVHVEAFETSAPTASKLTRHKGVLFSTFHARQMLKEASCTSIYCPSNLQLDILFFNFRCSWIFESTASLCNASHMSLYNDPAGVFVMSTIMSYST